MVLLTPQTPGEITSRIIKDYRNAWKPMGIETMPEVFSMDKIEKDLLPVLQYKLYLINVDYMPTNEEPLKKYPGSGYELTHIKGTCHFPMLENPRELNSLLEDVINKM